MFIPLGHNKLFNVCNLHGLNENSHWFKSFIGGHKLKRNFRDCLDEICLHGKDIESTNQCSLFLKERQVLMNKIRYIDSLLTSKNEVSLFCTLLFLHFFIS